VDTRKQERKGGESRRVKSHSTLFVKKDKPEGASIHSFSVIIQSPVLGKLTCFGIIYIIKVSIGELRKGLVDTLLEFLL
jgi:hypothetical protein